MTSRYRFTQFIFLIPALLLVILIIHQPTGYAVASCGDGICTASESCEWNGALSRQMLCDGKQSSVPKEGLCAQCIYYPAKNNAATIQTATCGNSICEVGEPNQQKCPQCVLDHKCRVKCDYAEGSCPSDCPSTCGDQFCNNGETNATCYTDCPIMCGNNVCEPGETCSTCSRDCGTCASCTDTDGGIQKNLKGTVSGVNPSGQPYTYTDTCYSTTNLLEYFCSGTTATSQLLNCDNGYTCTDGSCQIVQPYCGDNTCNNGETCGTCANDCGACPLPANCNAIAWDNNDLRNHVNFVFVPSNFNGDMQTFETNARRIWNSFNSYTPYQSDVSLNAFFVTSEQGNYCTQPCNGIPQLLCCDTAKAKTISSTCTPNARQTIVVQNSETYGGAGYMGEDVATVTLHPIAPTIAVHETGHSFGNLADEYNYGLNTNLNCDTASCSKWDEMMSMNWGVSCTGGTHQCTSGYCQYCSNGNYYIGEVSIMYALNYQFEEVNERAMCCAYHQETGSYPSYCNKFKTLNPSLDTYCGVSATAKATSSQQYLQNPTEYTFIKTNGKWKLESITPKYSGYYDKDLIQGKNNGEIKLVLSTSKGMRTYRFSNTTLVEAPGINNQLGGTIKQERKVITLLIDSKEKAKSITINDATIKLN